MPRTSRLILVVAALVAAPAAARAQLGIDLSAPPAKKQDEKRPKKPAEPGAADAKAARPRSQAPQGLDLKPLDVGKNGAAKQRLDAAKKLLDDKAYETAALAFDQIVRDPSLAEVHDEARYQLAKSLVRLGLYHSALTELDEILSRGPQGSKYFHNAIEWLFYVGRRIKNEQPLIGRVARYARDGFPPSYEDRFHFLLAKYEFERGRALQEAGRGTDARGAWDEARRLAGLVRREAGGAPPPSSTGELPAEDQGDVYAKARFVDGLVLYAEGDERGAAESFKEVVRLTNPKRGRHADPELRELAFLQLARIHYQNRQNRYAIFYYDKMPWGGENWLEGLWEASYAHYRIGDYEKTLGNLLTLQSPYFRDEYFPESYILKAIVYYENCRYPEARRILEDFASLYEPVYEELASITGRSQAVTAYYDLIEETERSRASGDKASIMRKIMKLSFTDQNIKRLSESIGEIEDEMDRGIGGRRSDFRQSALGSDLVERLRAERGQLVDEAGRRARQKLEYERDQLRTLLAQALRIKIEVSRKEREMLEGSLAKGSQVEVVKDLKYSTAVSDEHLYWPYEGEFWRDELGTYSYTLTRGCKDRLPRSSPTAATR